VPCAIDLYLVVCVVVRDLQEMLSFKLGVLELDSVDELLQITPPALAPVTGNIYRVSMLQELGANDPEPSRCCASPAT
jgi:hypothetical protein